LYFLVAFWRAYNQSGWMDKLTLWVGLVGAVALALDMALHLDAAIPWARHVPLPARIVTCAVFSAIALWKVGRLVFTFVKRREPVAYYSGSNMQAAL
jgi:hypothetical protein